MFYNSNPISPCQPAKRPDNSNPIRSGSPGSPKNQERRGDFPICTIYNSNPISPYRATRRAAHDPPGWAARSALTIRTQSAPVPGFAKKSGAPGGFSNMHDLQPNFPLPGHAPRRARSPLVGGAKRPDNSNPIRISHGDSERVWGHALLQAKSRFFRRLPDRSRPSKSGVAMERDAARNGRNPGGRQEARLSPLKSQVRVVSPRGVAVPGHAGRKPGGGAEARQKPRPHKAARFSFRFVSAARSALTIRTQSAPGQFPIFGFQGTFRGDRSRRRWGARLPDLRIPLRRCDFGQG